MSSWLVNIFVLISMIMIIAGVIFVFYMSGRLRGGKKKPGLARPSKAHYRQVNPKTGDLFR